MNHAPAAQRAARSIALIAAALLSLCVCLLALPSTAHAARTYGQLCEKYESNGNPYALDDSNPPGGNVYGAYQMSAGNALKYAKQLQTKYTKTHPEYAKYGKALEDAYEKDGKAFSKNFSAAWKSIFPNQKSAYYQTQYNYVKSVYYDDAAKRWASEADGFNPNSKQYSHTLRNVIFSTSVQHGPAGSASIFAKAMKAIGGYSESLTEWEIIEAVYAERSRVTTKKALRNSGVTGTIRTISESDYNYNLKHGLITKEQAVLLKGSCLAHFYQNSGNIQVGVYVRLANNEPAAAKALLESYQAKDYAISYHLDGGTNSADNPASHKGGTTVSLAQPEKQGYRFLGWFTKAQGKGEQVKSLGGFTTASVYAFWEKVVFQISYQLNGGALSGSYKNEFHVDDKSFKLPVPTRSGYLFQGWYTTKSFKDGTQISKVAKGTAEDLKVYAKWVKGYYAKVSCKGGLTVRAKASTSAAPKGVLKNGSKVIITKTSKGWGKLAEGGWVKLSYTKKL